MSGEAPILVATCGNVMAGDDALGPLVARALRQFELPGVKVADLDLRPAALLDLLEHPRRLLIIVDAVRIDDAALGEVIDLDWCSGDRPTLVHDDVLSTHGLSIANQLELAEPLGMLPAKVRLIGAAIADAVIGEHVSAGNHGAIDAVVARVREHCAPQREEAHCA